jgi:hypothetical protein
MVTYCKPLRALMTSPVSIRLCWDSVIPVDDTVSIVIVTVLRFVKVYAKVCSVPFVVLGG